jgi:hypothetical protein
MSGHYFLAKKEITQGAYVDTSENVTQLDWPLQKGFGL